MSNELSFVKKSSLFFLLFYLAPFQHILGTLLILMLHTWFFFFRVKSRFIICLSISFSLAGSR
jgi:hypothetical protein